jgi:hypothetical protein
MPSRKKTEDSSIYQLKVVLRYSSVPIWRKIQVAGDTTLEDLHWTLQKVMPWDNDHLHQFVIKGSRFVPLRMVDGWAVDEDKDEAEVTLREVAPLAKTRFVYEYDLGASWVHEILVERIIPPQPGIHYPICLKGAGACPPEDCGGMGGYHNMLQAITTRSIRNSRISKNGWARILIPKHSTWIRPTVS